ncbi:hypothetical protein ACNKHX_21700 [Shigella flexneri]
MTATIILGSANSGLQSAGEKFFDELHAFFTELEKSGRKVMGGRGAVSTAAR